jgi:DNA gyrase inhibitor GyrI
MSTTSKLAMNRKIVPMNTLGTVALAIVLCGVGQSQTQGPKTPYPSMAPIEQYLMDRNAEIALARSAAPHAWKDLHQLVPGISEHNKITGYMSLYKVGPKAYRAGVSLAAGANDLPEGLQSTKIKGGKYSRFVLTGPYSGLPEACARVFEIVAETKIGLRDDYCIENDVNDPPRTTPEQQLIPKYSFPRSSL